MKKWVIRAGLAASAYALLATGSRTADAGTIHYPNVSPGPLLLNPIGSSGSGCIDKNIYGGLSLFQAPTLSVCPFSTGGASGWSPWRGGDVNVAWSPNPGSTVSANWASTVPANSEFRARLALLNDSGSVISIGSFVNGGGLKTGSVDVLATGILVLNFQMRGFRSGTSGLVPTPVLRSVAGQHYSD